MSPRRRRAGERNVSWPHTSILRRFRHGEEEFQTYSVPHKSQLAWLKITRVPNAGPSETVLRAQPVVLEAAHGIVLGFEAPVVEEDDNLAGIVGPCRGWVEGIELGLY